ncbi:homeobox domain-containing protein CYBJADRAFT_118113, partial [Cyberlindnera jadinii NRRL Y-1542]
KRTNLPRETIEILNDWIVNNLDNPYPNHTQKRMLLEKTGLSNVQLSNWFINKRRRRLFS